MTFVRRVALGVTGDRDEGVVDVSERGVEERGVGDIRVDERGVDDLRAYEPGVGALRANELVVDDLRADECGVGDLRANKTCCMSQTDQQDVAVACLYCAQP